jgi:hypothetical protein
MYYVLCLDEDIHVLSQTAPIVAQIFVFDFSGFLNGFALLWGGPFGLLVFVAFS